MANDISFASAVRTMIRTFLIAVKIAGNQFELPPKQVAESFGVAFVFGLMAIGQEAYNIKSVTAQEILKTLINLEILPMIWDNDWDNIDEEEMIRNATIELASLFGQVKEDEEFI